MRARAGSLWATAWLWAAMAAVQPVAMAQPASSSSQPQDALTFEAFQARHVPSDATLLDRHGTPLAAWRNDDQRRRLAWVRLEDISPRLVEALLVAEDQRFLHHGGVDWLAVANVLWKQGLGSDAAAGGKTAPRGASSLSMQVAALLDPGVARQGAARDWPQKWKQMQAALALEARWSKTQILEAYLNTISFRGELQGLGAASWGLFGKAPSGLDRSESALLAALIRAPSASPLRVARRACQILRKTRGADAACDAPMLAAQLEAASLNPQPVANVAPHAARRLLGGANPWPAEQRSSLLHAAQTLANEALREQLTMLSAQGAQDGAVVVLDNVSGQVLAYVGSSGGLSKAAQVDAATALRQAGSTLKPFLYGLAFDKGVLHAASVLDDTPLNIHTDVGLYVPRNYNERYAGPVSVRKALASSLNVPAVRALMLTGVADWHRQLQRFGLSSLHPAGEHYGYSLALGSADVSLLELTNAYRALANGGVFSPVQFAAAPGAQLPAGVRVMQAGHAWLVGNILSDNAARESTFGFDSVLATPFWSAVKTGTSKDMRDNWCVGYSSHYTVGVWVGNASGAPMRNVSGVSGAAPTWAAILRGLHEGRGLGVASSAPPAPPAGWVAQRIRFERETEAPRLEWFAAARRPVPDTQDPTWHTVTLSHGTTARIVSPQHGALIAWDPDIPADRQAIALRHSGLPGTGDRQPDAFRWLLNQVPVEGRLLRLQPGAHQLSLVSGEGAVVDTVRFEVRGLRARNN